MPPLFLLLLLVSGVSGGSGGCDYGSLESLNRDLVKPLIDDIVERPFFKYFRLSLCSQCTHAFPPPMCASPECQVCECSRADLPCDPSGKCFLEPPELPTTPPSLTDDCKGSVSTESAIDLLIDDKTFEAWQEEGSDPWTNEEITSPSYIDLTRNPERWTGYTGDQGSSKIWTAIYDENCAPASGTCLGGEREFLYRIFSGLHTSISTHIMANCCLRKQQLGPCLEWGANIRGFAAAVGRHPDRVANMKFLYGLLLNAAERGGEFLAGYDYNLGNTEDTKAIKVALESLSLAFPSLCPHAGSPISTGGVSRDALPDLVRTREIFRNVSSIMDCVGCDKCKLWGKLQFQGIGAALRILYAPEGVSPTLTRTEVIAFVNTLARVATSLSEASHMLGLLPPPTPFEAAIQHTLAAWTIIKRRIHTMDLPRIKLCLDESVHAAHLYFLHVSAIIRGEEEEASGIPGDEGACPYADRVRALVAVYFAILSVAMAISWGCCRRCCSTPDKQLNEFMAKVDSVSDLNDEKDDDEGED